MVEDSSRKACIHLLLGQFGQDRFTASQSSDDLFMAVTQLNLSKELIVKFEERQELARLNLKAANAAVSQSAYRCARLYLEQGLSVMDDRWQEGNYKLSLNLASTAAEVFSSLGEHEESDKLIDEILGNAKTLADKSRAYIVRTESYGFQDRLEDGCSEIMTVLKEYGVRLPQNPHMGHVGKDLLFLLAGIRGKDLLQLPKIQNMEKLSAIKLLVMLGCYAWFSGKENLICVAFLQAARLTLKYGMSDYAPHAISGYAMILSISGALEEGCRIFKIAEELLELCQSKRSEVFVLCIRSLVSPSLRTHVFKGLKTCSSNSNFCHHNSLVDTGKSQSRTSSPQFIAVSSQGFIRVRSNSAFTAHYRGPSWRHTPGNPCLN